jgi:hypothetical protein
LGEARVRTGRDSTQGDSSIEIPVALGSPSPRIGLAEAACTFSLIREFLLH